MLSSYATPPSFALSLLPLLFGCNLTKHTHLDRLCCSQKTCHNAARNVCVSNVYGQTMGFYTFFLLPFKIANTARDSETIND
uniref:Putative secreted protein n=1 Tax=Anopheles darlingi TaxID=43151 RepID=A0A2M4DGR9_ANODA